MERDISLTDDQNDTADDSQDSEFMRGYAEDEEVIECAECGTAVKDEKRVLRKIQGEEYVFCSNSCATDFEESIVEE